MKQHQEAIFSQIDSFIGVFMKEPFPDYYNKFRTGETIRNAERAAYI